MNWITDSTKFKSISKNDLLVVYAANWSERHSITSATKSYYIARSDEDYDFDCEVTGNTLKGVAALYILTPYNKWITGDTSLSSVSGKYVIWGHEYDPNVGVNTDAPRSYYVCEHKTFGPLSSYYGKDGWYTSDNRRIWAFAIQSIPDLPISYPVIHDLFDDLEHYYKVKINGVACVVNSPSGNKSVIRYDGQHYDISQPVKIKNKTISIAYRD